METTVSVNARMVTASSALGLLASALFTPAAYAQCDATAQVSETATGVVFEDLNRDGRLGRDEPAVAGVSVSNGCDVVLTDAAGFYEIGLAPGQILFVTQPSGYEVPVDGNNVPRFFYSHYPDGTPTEIDGTTVEWQWPVIEPTGPLPASIDFPLHRLGSPETRFTAHAFADPQARSDLGEDMLREELVNTLLGNPYGAEFALTVGDVVFDNLGLYDRHKEMIGLIGIPQWTLPGNHDMNFESPNAHFATETYKKHFGPTYYSFDYGNVHVVALNNVEYAGAAVGRYRGFISEDQIRWLEQDLAQVPRDKLIVIATHISLISEASDGDPSHTVTGPRTENFDRLLELLRPFEHVYGLAGHDTSNSWKVEINHEHGWTGQPWIAHTLAEVRGSGWTRGPRDLRGVADAMMEDGNPNGFYLLEFDDVTLVPEFIPFPFGRDAAQRLRIVLDPELEHADGSINRGALAAGTKVVVNLFDGGVRDRVRMSLDGGPSTPMRYVVRTDPFVVRTFARLVATENAYPPPAVSAHIWELELPDDLATGLHSVVVETEDEFGQRNRGALSFEVMGAEVAWREAFPTFERHEIPFENGSFSTAFDVDEDGRRDIVVLGRGVSPLVWYKNPTWERYTISTTTDRNIHIAPHDIDGDGDIDIAIASEFALNESTSGGEIAWLENPGDPTANQEWTLRQIDAVPTSHRMRWGDIDGDGTKELLNLPIVGIGAEAPEYVGASQFIAYSIPSDRAGPWTKQVLDDTRLEVAHGIQVVDWDGDAAEDVLTASNDGVRLFQPGLGREPWHLGAGVEAARPDRGSSEVSLGTLGGERFIAALEPWHGTDAVIYRPGDSERAMWSRQVIGSDFEGGHGVVAVDLNGDGFDEVVGGGRGGDGSLLIYRYVPASTSWERIPLDIGGVAVQSLEAHDIDGDGDQDILVMGGASNAVVWYENLFDRAAR